MFQFTLTSPAVTMALLLTLVNIAIVTPQEMSVRFNYLRPGYTFVELSSWSSLRRSYSAKSVTECALMALNRMVTSDVLFFSYNKTNQLCSTYASGTGVIPSGQYGSHELCLYKADTTLMVYRVSIPTEASIYNSFYKIPPYAAGRSIYRNMILDSWINLPIVKAQIIGYKSGTVVVDLRFDVRNSTLRNWFQYERLLNKPWTDLNATSFNMFSALGNEVDRSFSIGYFGDNCDEDRGWFTVIDRPFNCSYANFSHYPAILYANSKTQTYWNQGKSLISPD
ncbi:uncharacterized protein LOC118763953 isoform X2 [Octopus sinensis]|uniref:Uncharacterized protein LOC118763953 isoform X2 n=1 Tax=Octopus sinensis TaxID=2607531 RepID=A0A7E6EY28_9MOLL|nr:uncharacterized protein LOC118763953 isoform X2 [Octopus sinensis]